MHVYFFTTTYIHEWEYRLDLHGVQNEGIPGHGSSFSQYNFLMHFKALFFCLLGDVLYKDTTKMRVETGKAYSFSLKNV